VAASRPVPTPEVNPLADLRRLLSRRPSTLMQASAPELCAALPLLVRFFEHYETLERRVHELEELSALNTICEAITPL
jgi:hypothetical protein